VKWTPGADNGDVVDERGASVGGGGGGGGWGAPHYIGGGGGAVLVIYLVARLFGVDLGGILGGGSSSDQSGPVAGPHDNDTAHPQTGPDPDAELVQFVKFVTTDVENVDTKLFEAEGKPYRRAKLVLFSHEINTGCGLSSSEVGPFYCPADEHVYIDLSFYKELRQRFGAPGNFAQAYVIAHELGHHIQNLLGIEQKVQSHAIGPRGETRNESSVRLELQADCFAGVWGHAAQGKGLLEPGDVEGALTAASAIGDDRLQKQAGRSVNPESFTHGTSAQRMKWFKRGFDGGTLESCDTFSGEI
jgi:hypothetical protein